MAAAGEPVAVLWASEGRIYQRFGYGLAVRKLALTARRSRAQPRRGPADQQRTPRDAPVADLRPTMVKIFDEVVADRPGWSERAERHWDYRLADGEHNRNGASPLRVIVHEGDGGPDGYALWRVTNEWNENGPNATVRVLECVATNPEAYTQLWRFLLSVDLTRSLSFWAASPDEPLLFLVNEVRQLGGRLDDAVWLRVVDLPAALAARRYATEVDVVLEVRDDLIPANAGRWHLTGSPTTASCVATTDPADLICDIRVIGAAYLGGSPLLRPGRRWAGDRGTGGGAGGGDDRVRLAPLAFGGRSVLTLVAEVTAMADDVTPARRRRRVHRDDASSNADRGHGRRG